MGKIKPNKKVCLITPGHLCNCPRLIKEASALYSAGYQISIISTSYMPFLIEQDNMIATNNQGWNIYTKYWHRGTLWGYVNKYQNGFLKIFKSFFSKKAIFPRLLNRNFDWQLKTAIGIKADLYIAHSAASIPVASRAANINETRFAFDAEDFHTGEDLSADNLTWIDFLQKRYLPEASYISAASPLIADAYENYLGRNDIATILNVFPKNINALKVKERTKTLRLFWFSQNIGKGRGLEWVFEALSDKQSDEIEFHVLGNLRDQERMFFNELSDFYNLPAGMIYFHQTIPETELLELARNYDIGISLETGKPLNRDLCLSNKLFVYLYAGLGIIATDTHAQKLFFKEQTKGTVFLSLKDPKQLSHKLSWLIKSPDEVIKMREFNYELAKKEFNWDKEQVKFISIVNQCL